MKVAVMSVPSHKGFFTTIGQFHHISCAANKAQQDSHLDYNFLASLNLFTIKMPFVMRILVMHTNGQLVAWHDHLTCKLHIQLWTIAYPSQKGKGVYVAQRTESLLGQLGVLPGHLPAIFRARNGRVVSCCLLRTAYNGVHTICYYRQIVLLTHIV